MKIFNLEAFQYNNNLIIINYYKDHNIFPILSLEQVKKILKHFLKYISKCKAMNNNLKQFSTKIQNSFKYSFGFTI